MVLGDDHHGHPALKESPVRSPNSSSLRRSDSRGTLCRQQGHRAMGSVRPGHPSTVRPPRRAGLEMPSIHVADRESGRSEADAHARRTINGFSSKIPRVSGLMRGLSVPWDCFFSSASGTSRSANNRSIDAPKLIVDLSAVDESRPQAIEYTVDRSIGIPLVEPFPSSFAAAVFVRQIPPRRTGSHDPEYRIEDHASIGRRSSRPRRLRQQIGDILPLLIRELMPWHNDLHESDTSFPKHCYDRSRISRK
jgi:hypothetical protein